MAKRPCAASEALVKKRSSAAQELEPERDVWITRGHPSAFVSLAGLIDRKEVRTAADYLASKRGDKSNGVRKIRQAIALYSEKGKLTGANALEVSTAHSSDLPRFAYEGRGRFDYQCTHYRTRKGATAA